MRLWRISNHASLSGEGGLHASGRWHTRGRRVVYLADHPASALLEVMVHLEIDSEDLPTHYQLLGVDVPDDLSITRLDKRELADGWREQVAVTRTLGDNWLRDASAALLCVPSAIVPDASNYLLNPAHPGAARISLTSAMRAAFDSRLMAFVKS
ncbi:MAG: RES family NAD+ phosphorylase [Xanthobacteraceae bacterium]